MSYVNISYPDGNVHEIEDRSVFTKGRGLDRLVDALECLAVRGWNRSTPVGVTVHLADGRDVRIDAGRDFLNELTMGAPAKPDVTVMFPVVEIRPRVDASGWSSFDWPPPRAELPVWIIGGVDVNGAEYSAAECEGMGV